MGKSCYNGVVNSTGEHECDDLCRVAVLTIILKVLTFEDIIVDPGTGTIYHTEVRPAEPRLIVVDTNRRKDMFGKD